MLKKIILIILLLQIINVSSQDNVKLMFYNLLHFPTTQPSRISNLEIILNNYQPDIFMVCELENAAGSASILTAIQTDDNRYAAATYENNHSTPSSALQQMVYYNTHKMSLSNEQIHQTIIRDINHYTFLLSTPDSDTNPKYLDVFITHLKAGAQNQGGSPTNGEKRAIMVDEFVSALDNIPVNHYVIFAGDFNLYTSTEPAYQKILDTNNNIIMVDPIDRPGDWNDYANRYVFQDIFTQSAFAYDASLPGYGNDHIGDGSSGGIDDRFDFIMMSDNLNDQTQDLHYKIGTYAAFGNNGNCYNKSVNDPTCTGTYSQALRDAMFNFSDHLPVVMEIETTQNLLTTTNTAFTNNFKLYNSNIVENIIEINNTTFENGTIYIYNLLGKLVTKQQINNKRISIDVSNLANGMYYIKSSNNTKALKFIKK